MISNVAAWIEGVAREGLTLHRSTPKSAPLPLIAKPVVVSPIKNINLDGNIAGLLAEPVLSVRTPRRFSLGVALGLPLLAGNLAAITVFFSPSLTHSVLSAALSSPVVSASFGSLFSGSSISGAAKDHEIESRLQRIKQYEGQLRLKASQIESVLRETSELDFDGISRSESRLRVTPSGVKGEHGGIGEGDGSLNWVLPGTPSKRDDLSALPQGSLAELVDSQVKKLRELPIGYPVEGDLSSGFGYRVSPFAQRIKMHEGIDLSGDRESRVLATGDGKVVHAGYKGSFGNVVVIDHGHGFQTVYAHLARITASVGDRICRGEALGLLGMSGHSTGPHLHYEIHIDGRPRNPEPFLKLASLLNNLL